MKGETKQAIIGLAVLAFLATAIILFSGSKTTSSAPGISFFADNSLSMSSDSVSSTSSTGWSLDHHSIPTKMSLQGNVTDFNGVAIPDGNLEVKISDANSCISQVFYDHNFFHAIQNGKFNLLLGQNENLPLNFNQDYYMCLYVNNQQLSGPQVFRGGQGEVHSEQLFDGNATNPVDFNSIRSAAFNCSAASGGVCMLVPVNTYPFAAAPGSGMLFNNVKKAFSFDVSYEPIYSFFVGPTSTGMFNMKPSPVDLTFATGIPSGSYFTKTLVDRNTLMIYDNNVWREVGSKLSSLAVSGDVTTTNVIVTNDIEAQDDVTIFGNLYGQLLGGMSPVGRACDATCDDFDLVQSSDDFSCIGAFELDGTVVSCSDTTNIRNCVCKS